jgi:hypothetical protein
VAALYLILRLVIDAARRPAIFMRQTFLNPVTVEAELVEQRRASAAQIVNSKWLKRQPVLRA